MAHKYGIQVLSGRNLIVSIKKMVNFFKEIVESLPTVLQITAAPCRRGSPGNLAMPNTKKGKKGNAAKKVKDPNKPKGKLSAFMFFSADQRITLKTEQPGRATVCDVPTC